MEELNDNLSETEDINEEKNNDEEDEEETFSINDLRQISISKRKVRQLQRPAKRTSNPNQNENPEMSGPESGSSTSILNLANRDVVADADLYDKGKMFNNFLFDFQNLRI